MADGSCCSPDPEECNGEDDDCDGVVDSFIEGCGIGRCSGGTRTCTSGSWGGCSTSGNAQSETCNNIDDDCDGSVDEDLTMNCGTGLCSGGVVTCTSGVWGSCSTDVNAVSETCNNIDDDCDYLVDEDGVCLEHPDLTVISLSPAEKIFRFVVLNGGVDNNFTWRLDTGDSIIQSEIPMELEMEETVMTYVKHKYADSGSYFVTVNVSGGEISETGNLSVTISMFELDDLSIVNSSQLRKVVSFILENNMEENLENVSWSIDTGNNVTIENYITLTLQGGERTLVYAAYEYPVAGHYNIEAEGVCTSNSDNKQLNLTI